MRAILKISQLFGGLDNSSLDEVCAAGIKRKFARSETIFYENDEAFAFFIVGSGKVKVFKTSPDGKEQILRLVGPGDTFAEAALFAGGRYPASAQTLENTELVMIQRDRFLELLERKPELALNLIANLSGLLRKLTSLVEGLSLTDVTSRLAHHLIELLDKKTGSLVLEEKKSTLASELGTIPETLSRSFARLTKEKIIEVDGSNISIIDYARLEEIAGR